VENMMGEKLKNSDDVKTSSVDIITDSLKFKLKDKGNRAYLLSD
jgi:hypothetical protein